MLKTISMFIFVCVVVSCVNCALALECPDGIQKENCTLSTVSKDSTNKTNNQEVTTNTPKPLTLPKSMNMLAEDQMDTMVSLNNATEEPKGRALNFTIKGHSNSNVLSTNASSIDKFGDLSDVSLDNEDVDDDEDNLNEEHQHTAKILTSKTSTGSNVTNTTLRGICEKGGLTYENGEKLEIGCDSICTCTNGKMECTDRCTGPFFRKGKKIDDTLCTAKETEDPCCSILVCAADTETEPLEICSFDNKTYHRGEIFKKGCEEICTCEIAGKTSCKTRCPPVNKTSDRCVEVQDPSDSCCKKVLCDVTLHDHDADKDEEMQEPKLTSAKFINESTVELEFDTKPESKEFFVEGSEDKINWKTYTITAEKFVQVMGGTKYLRLENSDHIVELAGAKTVKNQVNEEGCSYKEQSFKFGEEFNDNCTSLCVCKASGMKCLKLECPTYFGVDVLDPNCIEWETVPLNFQPKAPNCCPEKLRCKSNGSCLYQGKTYENWQQLPTNVTGCDKRCYCEMGNVECQTTCPPVTALPPPLPCPPHQAMVGHQPDDDCCMTWICNPQFQTETGQNKTNNDEKNKTEGAPSKNLGPLLIYTNNNNNISNNKIPSLSPDENPYFHKNDNSEPFIGPLNPTYTKKPKPKPSKEQGLFVTPPPLENLIPHQGNTPQIQIHSTHTNPDELLQFINKHPEIANYPSGSVLEIHNIPKAPVRPHQQIIPYVIPQNHNDLPPGITLEQILQEINKNIHPSRPIPSYTSGPILVAPQSPIQSPRQNSSHQGLFPGNYPHLHQPQDEIIVHSLEARDAHTVHLTFMVQPVIVGLHGRVEVRYTHNDNPDLSTWELQVFAPPDDLIATPQLEFDLLDLKADTEYKIKITVTLRDLHNTPSSRIYKIRTPKDVTTTTLPPMIPIEPDLAITDINATWVTVVWRKFTEYELQFIDGVQLRFKEIDGKIYDATPLIHRSVTSYTLENLKPNTKYEIGIFFIPFPGQLTELHAAHMLHFTTSNEIDTYGFNVILDISHIKSTSVEIAWSGVPYPEDKYVNIYRAIYQSDSGKEDHSTFKIAKRDSPTKTIIMDLKPGTRYRLWLEVYLTNGKIKTSNVQDFITKPRVAPTLGASSQQDKLLAGEHRENKGDYYGPLVIVAILASIAILSTLILLLILVRRHNQNKAAITPPARVSQSAYDNPTYKVEIQQETMGL